MSSISRFQALLAGTPQSGKFWRMSAGKRSVVLVVFDPDDNIIDRKTFTVSNHGGLFEAYRAAMSAARYWDNRSKMSRVERDREITAAKKVRRVSIMEEWSKQWRASGHRSESSPIASKSE
jgi:hypothetical protein